LTLIPFSAPYSRKPSAYIRPSMWATKFHSHVKQKGQYFLVENCEVKVVNSQRYYQSHRVVVSQTIILKV
jgi:hypothetical protein